MTSENQSDVILFLRNVRSLILVERAGWRQISFENFPFLGSLPGRFILVVGIRVCVR